MGVINADTMAYQAAKARHADALARVQEEERQRTMIKVLELDVNTMKTDLAEIKNALALLLNKLG
jgi:DNA mismatch repair ATPase MutS